MFCAVFHTKALSASYFSGSQSRDPTLGLYFGVTPVCSNPSPCQVGLDDNVRWWLPHQRLQRPFTDTRKDDQIFTVGNLKGQTGSNIRKERHYRLRWSNEYRHWRGRLLENRNYSLPQLRKPHAELRSTVRASDWQPWGIIWSDSDQGKAHVHLQPWNLQVISRPTFHC